MPVIVPAALVTTATEATKQAKLTSQRLPACIQVVAHKEQHYAENIGGQVGLTTLQSVSTLNRTSDLSRLNPSKPSKSAG